MTREEIIEEVQNWSGEKTDICANIHPEFRDYYNRLSGNVVDVVFDDFEGKANRNTTFLGIIGGLVDSIIIGLPEKDVRYYALIAVLYDTIHNYQDN